MVSAKDVAALRAETGLGMMDCKEALVEANGDTDKAKAALRQKFNVKSRAAKQTLEGHVGHYVHMGGKIAVLVEVDCETDFVARNADFQEFVHNLAIHVAASNPQWLCREDVDSGSVSKEVEFAKANIGNKPEAVKEKIISGRMDKFYKETCFLEQAYVKDNNITISDLLAEMSAKTGERLVIKRFVRFEVGR